MAENFFPVIAELAARVEKLDQRVLINTVIQNFPHIQKLIIQLNTRGLPTSQLFELNVDATGIRLNDIGGNYSPFTIEESKKPGRTPKKSEVDINLFHTGEYYDSKHITFDSIAADYFNMISDPIKADGTNLETEWSPNLDGLIVSNWDIVNKAVLPLLNELILKSVA